MKENNFDYTNIDNIVNSIKQLTDEEIDQLVEVSMEHNLTQDSTGLKQTFLDIRSDTI
jgi:hypothetical protein